MADKSTWNLSVRLPLRLKSEVVARAESDGVSINSWMASVVERAVEGEGDAGTVAILADQLRFMQEQAREKDRLLANLATSLSEAHTLVDESHRLMASAEQRIQALEAPEEPEKAPRGIVGLVRRIIGV